MQLLIGVQASANLNLAAQALMISVLWVGFYLAHTGRIPRHCNVQTTVVLLNIVFIASVMDPSLYAFIGSGGATRGRLAALLLAHAALGGLAELTGLYLVLMLRTGLIPPAWRVRNYAPVMRSLLGLWTLVFTLGASLYYRLYIGG